MPNACGTLSFEDIDIELYGTLRQAFLSSKNVMGLVNTCDKILYRRMEDIIVSDALQSCYSERQLSRLFLTQIGMSMKHFARLIRFNYVLKHIQTKAISGISPQKLFENHVVILL